MTKAMKFCAAFFFVIFTGSIVSSQNNIPPKDPTEPIPLPPGSPNPCGPMRDVTGRELMAYMTGISAQIDSIKNAPRSPIPTVTVGCNLVSPVTSYANGDIKVTCRMPKSGLELKVGDSIQVILAMAAK